MPDTMKQDTCNRRAFLGRAATITASTAFLAAKAAKAQQPNKNSRLGVGIIGCGRRGHSHMNAIKALMMEDNSVEVVALCDVYRPRLKNAAKAFKCAAYMDHHELLADPNVDIVSIATPDHHHGLQAIDAVRAGKAVYCEKPVTHWRQFDVIKTLAQEVKKSGKAFQLGTQGMSDGAWHKMKQLVRDGLIGQPVHAECGYFRTGDWGERGMSIDDPNAKPGPDLDWEAFLGDSPKRDFDVSRFFRWRMYEDYAGGPVTDLFPHSLTPVIDILGVGMPESAVGLGGIMRYPEREVPDTFNMLVSFPEKITVSVQGTQGNQYQGTGERGAGKRIPVIRGWDGALTVERKHIVFIPTPESKKEKQRFKIDYDESMRNHYRNLITCVKEGRQDTWSPVDLAYRTQTALLMGNMSMREGKTVHFDPQKEEIVL